jgi:hypothetical protein
MIITAALITWIIKAVAVIEVVTAVAVLILDFTQIIDWFAQRRTNIPAVDNAKIYFTLKELWATGNYNTVQGVFDTRTKQLGDLRRVHSRDVDARLAEEHRNHRLLNYT